MFQTGGREDWESFDDTAQTLAQDEALKICHNSFPLVVVRIRKPFERQFGRKEAIDW